MIDVNKFFNFYAQIKAEIEHEKAEKKREMKEALIL